METINQKDYYLIDYWFFSLVQYPTHRVLFPFRATVASVAIELPDLRLLHLVRAFCNRPDICRCRFSLKLQQ